MASISRLYSRKMEIYYQKKNYENATYLMIHDHPLTKDSRIITLGKLTSIKIYSILISKVQNKTSSNVYFENLFNNYNIYWTVTYMLPRLVTYFTYMQSFQQKTLTSVLLLDKQLHTFGRKLSPLCSFCNLYYETPLNIFYECDAVKCSWADLIQYFQNNLILPTFTPQSAIFGILGSAINNSIF